MTLWSDDEETDYEAYEDVPEQEQEVSSEPILGNVSNTARTVFGLLLVLIFIGGALIAINAIAEFSG